MSVIVVDAVTASDTPATSKSDAPAKVMLPALVQESHAPVTSNVNPAPMNEVHTASVVISDSDAPAQVTLPASLQESHTPVTSNVNPAPVNQVNTVSVIEANAVTASGTPAIRNSDVPAQRSLPVTSEMDTVPLNRVNSVHLQKGDAKFLKVISYNVDGLSQEKFRSICDEVCDDCDVIIFIETFADSLKQYQLADFDSFASIRKRGVGARRNSGGLLVLIRKHISKFFKPLYSSISDIIWFRVSQLLLLGDVILGVGYCSPINSRVIENNSFFFHLEDDLYSHLSAYPNNKVILIGDFNARTGNLPDIISNETDHSCIFICDGGREFIGGDLSVPARVNSDKEVNTYGKNLINVCMEFGLCFCNGRSGRDNGLGSFTCITHNGASVVDYVLISYDLFDGISNFEVLAVSDFSVHLPLTFKMEVQTSTVIELGQNSINPNIVNPALNSNLDQRSKYVWKEQYESAFLLNLQRNAPDLLTPYPATADDINSSLDKFYQIIDNCASDMKCTPKAFQHHTLKAPKVHAPFFDSECLRAKSKLNKAHRELNESLRQNHSVGGLDQLVDFHLRDFTANKYDYKKLVKDKKQTYVKERESLARSLTTNSKDFWDYYKSNRKACSSQRKDAQISCDQWVNHTENLFSRQEAPELEIVDVTLRNTEILDSDITATEINEQISKLKNKKSPGPDGLCSQIIKKGKEFLLLFLITIFNCILSVGYYPLAWTEALVFMLYKKGDAGDVNNYRSISLLNIMSKLLSSILQKRLYKWCSSFNVLSENQFGFRPGRSTVDCIFIHNTLVQYHLTRKRRKLYVCYIDFSKAFDCVSWEILWYKLECLGISRESRFLKLLRAMYREVSCRVITPWGLTSKIQLFRGVRQGCILSPLLFAIFIDDVKEWLSGDALHEFSFQDGCVLTHLLFADDLALFSQSVIGLQRMINKLSAYCEKYAMKINVDKTKIVVYRNGGKLGRKEVWYLNSNQIQVVSKFRYLGVLLSSSGIWTAAQSELACRASKGLFCIKHFVFNSKINNVQILLKLFDSCIIPILNYGAEIWGFHKAKDVERVCDNFYKFVTKLPKNCNNIAARGELGRRRAHCERYLRIVKYWLRLISSSSQLPLFLQKAYKLQQKMDDEGRVVWLSDVRTLICSLGFSYEWSNQQVENQTAFIREFKSRLFSLEKIQFTNSILTSPRLQFYGHIKLELNISKYWESELPFCMRAQFCRLLCSGHNLAIELGRRLDIPRSERTCMLCGSNDVEDEVHFILKCSSLQNLREKYIPLEYRVMPGWNSALSLIINPENTDNLLKYCFHAFKLRDKKLNLDGD